MGALVTKAEIALAVAMPTAFFGFVVIYFIAPVVAIAIILSLALGLGTLAVAVTSCDIAKEIMRRERW